MARNWLSGSILLEGTDTDQDDWNSLLKNLKLRRMLNVYEEQLRAAEKAGITYSDFFAGLSRAQWHERQESALEWRIRKANLPERWSWRLARAF